MSALEKHHSASLLVQQLNIYSKTSAMKDSFTTNTALLRRKIRGYLQFGNQRFLATPERSLLEAYQSALIIKNVELEHFAGQKISPESVDYTESVMGYWQVYLAKNLSIIKVKLAEFRLSRSLLNTSNSVFLEKLKFIDEVIAKYIPQDEEIEHAIAPIEQPHATKPGGDVSTADFR